MQTREFKILCVDDQPSNLKLLDAILSYCGYKVIKAEGGNAALEIIRSQSIDLVLLDIMMPDLSGIEVCTAIKGDEKLRHIPVILLTSLTEKEDRIKGIEAGAEDFISKPFDREEVLARIKMLLKVKELNSSLSSSYENITNLTRFGEQIIRTFDPLYFNFKSKIESVFSQIIRKKDSLSSEPAIVLLWTSDGSKSSQWHELRYISDSFSSKAIDLDIESFVPEHGSTKTIVANKMGADEEFDLLSKKLSPLGIRVENMVGYLNDAICVFAINYPGDATKYDAAVIKSIVLQTFFLSSLSTQVRENEAAFEYLIYALARAAEENDKDTGDHILRVGEYSAIIAKELNLPEPFIKTIKLQAALHDVGKIHIDPALLRKNAPLTPEEYDEMKKHPFFGSKIIGDHPRLQIAKNIALCHHERWDGTGYPSGLKGEAIPIEARIANFADQYDALRNARCYKVAINHKETYKILTEGDGRTMPEHFDPKIIDAFKKAQSLFEEVFNEKNIIQPRTNSAGEENA